MYAITAIAVTLFFSITIYNIYYSNEIDSVGTNTSQEEGDVLSSNKSSNGLETRLLIQSIDVNMHGRNKKVFGIFGDDNYFVQMTLIARKMSSKEFSECNVFYRRKNSEGVFRSGQSDSTDELNNFIIPQKTSTFKKRLYLTSFSDFSSSWMQVKIECNNVITDWYNMDFSKTTFTSLH
ncbi:hypothetical protein AT730_04925 [Vibrio alginolyticus]|nr:hypothetical protein AT730_04925 [Vibrio alginolyticus]